MGRDLANRAAQQVERQHQGGTDLKQQIVSMEAQFQRAMPKGLEAKQLIRDIFTCMSNTPKLAICEPKSVLGAAMTCSQLGLRPGVGALGHAWILPFWDSKTGGQRAQLIIGYKGYIELGHRSEQIASLHSRIVYANDEFDMEYGAAEDRWVHKPYFTVGHDEPGAPRLFYAVGRLANGGYSLADPMTLRQMEQHRDRFAMARDKQRNVVGPWRDHFEAMAQKGLAVDTPIPTPAGWTTMGDLRKGDLVFDQDGQQCQVITKSEVKNIGCYRVTFHNGDSVVCDEEHRWVARIGGGIKGWYVLPIGELFKAKQAGDAVTVPVAAPLQADVDKLPIDPWLLGYWLGNGSRHNARVTCHVDDVDDVRERISESGYQVGTVRPDSRSRAVGIGITGGLKSDLRKHGILGTKRIPQAYLRGSEWQRRALLAGLIDSDGHIDASRGRVNFTSVDEYLRDIVAELAESLGEVVMRGWRIAKGYGKEVDAYHASWTPIVNPTTLPRKGQNYRDRQVGVYRGVKSIERIDSVPTQCISVDSPSSTYLCGKTMVPTHNTMLLRLMALLPKSTEISRALDNDGSVRVDLDPGAIDEPTHIDGEVIVDDEAAPDAGQPERERVEVQQPARDAGGDTTQSATMITERQLTAINTALSKEGLGGNTAEQREAKLAWLTQAVGREIGSTKDLTQAEATDLISLLKGDTK